MSWASAPEDYPSHYYADLRFPSGRVPKAEVIADAGLYFVRVYSHGRMWTNDNRRMSLAGAREACDTYIATLLLQGELVYA